MKRALRFAIVRDALASVEGCGRRNEGGARGYAGMRQLAGIVLMLGIGAAACLRTLSLEGAVTDASGAPIAGAKITAMGHAYATDSRGCFSLRERLWSPGPDHVVVKIEREGYKVNAFGLLAGTRRVSVILASSSSSERTTARAVADLAACR